MLKPCTVTGNIQVVPPKKLKTKLLEQPSRFLYQSLWAIDIVLPPSPPQKKKEIQNVIRTKTLSCSMNTRNKVKKKKGRKKGKEKKRKREKPSRNLQNRQGEPTLEKPVKGLLPVGKRKHKTEDGVHLSLTVVYRCTSWCQIWVGHNHGCMCDWRHYFRNRERGKYHLPTGHYSWRMQCLSDRVSDRKPTNGENTLRLRFFVFPDTNGEVYYLQHRILSPFTEPVFST